MYKILRITDVSLMRAPNSVGKYESSNQFENENERLMFLWSILICIMILVAHYNFFDFNINCSSQYFKTIKNY